MGSGITDEDQNETVYPHVRFRKVAGSLLLSSSKLIFRAAAGSETPFDWQRVAKHQVSPASYAKSLLKMVLADGSNATFQLPDRPTLERIRNDITKRLQDLRTSPPVAAASSDPSLSGHKRSLTEMSKGSRTSKKASFGELDATSLAVARSTVLSAHPSLRQQHQFLVEKSKTVSEEDFWKTHEGLLGEEYARMSGLAKAGSSSILQSHVPASGRVTLGVDEMKCIFILYPAVHRAYENMVPLELSDEQFWRKYLESEYFHRDRGRMGTAALNHAGGNTGDSSSKGKTSGPTMEEQDARAAAVGTDDLFSRYDQKLQAEKSKETAEGRHRRWGTKLAVGQFDLACTMETERGKLLQGPRDNHPPNQSDDGRGARVVEKYNRHWAMVLHPDEAHAGSDLLEIARKSAKDVLEDDDDAKPGGGVDVEMRRLVDFASTNNDEADHAAGQGLEGADFEPLELSNIDAYYTGQTENTSTAESDEELAKRHVLFAKVMAAKTKSVLQKATMNERDIVLAASCFPPPAFGYEILSALTKKMAMDSKTEAASLEMVNQLPEDFREKLLSYFRRSSELLRHFFGLRRLEEQRGSSASNQKLARIVLAMESFYREMEGMRKELSQTSTGELMRKMCLPIMDQLDWAFKLHREGSGGGGGGGFVDVEN